MFYADELPEPDRIYQGDIFKEQIIITIPPDLKLLRLDDDERYVLYALDELENAFKGNSSEALVANAVQTNVIVLSNTCDIDHREFVSIAPLFPLDIISNTDVQRSIKERKINYMFFLPSSGECPDSYADLNLINSVKKEILNLDNRTSSLSEYAQRWLQDTLYRYFCRPVYMKEVEYFKFDEGKSDTPDKS